MTNPIDIVDNIAAELQSLLPMKLEYRQKLDKKIMLEFNYNSNHIEGNTLTYGETELLLIFDKTTGNHELREYEEMKAHNVAFDLMKEWANDKERPLTEADIKNLHAILLVRPFWKEALTPEGDPTRRLIEVGNYKKYPNSVRLQNGSIFHYTSPDETPIEMGELMDWYRQEENAVHPVTLAAMLHYKFVRIHPFDDGNGRMSRLLMNYVLYKNNLPPVIIKSTDKKNYLFALNQADIGDYAPFISYIAQQLIWSLELALKAAKGESFEENDDLEKEIHVLRKELVYKDNKTEKSTAKTINDTILYHLLPVLQEMDRKLKPLQDLFFEGEVSLNYKTVDGESNKPIKLPMEKWDEKIKYWLASDIEIGEETLTYLQFQYILKGMKKSVSAHSHWITIEVWFNEYNYVTKAGNNQIQFPYGKKVEEEMQQQIVKPLLTDTIEQIRRYASK